MRPTPQSIMINPSNIARNAVFHLSKFQISHLKPTLELSQYFDFIIILPSVALEQPDSIVLLVAALCYQGCAAELLMFTLPHE